MKWSEKIMKVCELIEKLQRCAPNAIVEFECDDDWYCGEIRVVDQRSSNNCDTCVILKSE